MTAIETLTAFLDQLPKDSHERSGVLRAIEVLTYGDGPKTFQWPTNDRGDVEFESRSTSLYDHQGALVLRLSVFDEGGMQTMTVMIPASDVAGFMTQAVNHGSIALEFVASAWYRGDCKTCENVRLIDVPGKVEGSTTNVYCPDCNPKGGSGDALTLYPRVGWLDR